MQISSGVPSFSVVRCPLVFRLVLIGAIALATVGVFSSTLVAQNENSVQHTLRLIVPEPSRPIDPIQILEIKEGNETVVPGVAFEGDDDWLGKLSVKIKNVSKKDVVQMQVEAAFPETGKGVPGSPILLHVAASEGQRPKSASSNGDSQDRNVSSWRLLPGQDTTFSFASGYEDMKIGIEKIRPISSVTKVHLMYSVQFPDGTIWGNGEYREPKLNPTTHRTVYDPITFEQFEQYSGPK